jgi:putative CocE/NonD family hydrolase
MMTSVESLLASAEPEGSEETLYDVEVIRDLRIPTDDPDVTLSADLYRPAYAGPVPALVTVLPYRKDFVSGLVCGPSLRWFAARGYACVLVDFRGTGSSDGLQRPPFDAGEAADGVATIEWAAQQPWCDGNIGMWGASYGGIMSMRTATHHPRALKAILPVIGALDLERDFVHPAGARGCLASLAVWGTETLLSQLLPPLGDHHSPAEQRRWRDRLEAEPWMLDMFRHEPGDPVWRSRAIDASRIAVPTFCVAGWRDLFCDPSIRAYEQIDAPKKLLAGPWMHTSPEESPVGAVDFRAMALRWWDHWLRGVDSGFMDEPGVTAYVQGQSNEWRQFATWPPSRDYDVFAATDTTLLAQRSPDATAKTNDRSKTVIVEQRPDPTVGALGGLWGIASQFGLPLDQHDDDMRSLTCTTAPLVEDLVVAGRPELTVELQGAGALGRLVARLADVDEEDRSTLITVGTALTSEGTEVRVALNPSCYRIPAGHRLRIALGNADFPRLWPVVGDVSIPRVRLMGLDLSLPVVADDVGEVVELPAPPEPSAGAQPLGLRFQPRWTVARDIVSDGVEVTYGEETIAFTEDRQHLLELRHQARASVTTAMPSAARVHAEASLVSHMATGETVTVRVDTRLTTTRLIADGRVDVDGVIVFSRRWEA